MHFTQVQVGVVQILKHRALGPGKTPKFGLCVFCSPGTYGMKSEQISRLCRPRLRAIFYL